MSVGRAAWSAWNDKSFAPEPDSNWDDYAVTLMRYRYGRALYNNTVYSNLDRYSASRKVSGSLYKHIRGIVNPVARFVDLRSAKIYGGSLDMETAKRGAIPIAQADDDLLQAIIQLWKWSNWGIQKNLYVRSGEMCADSFIKVVDDREAAKVRMEVLTPESIKYFEKDTVGNIQHLIIEYEMDDSDAPVPGKTQAIGKSYTYTEVITPDSFSTFKDGEPFDYYGGGVEWHNDYGFVPVVHAKAKDVGMMRGATAYHASVRKIDEVNDAASMLNDQIRKIIQPIWYFAGVTRKAEITASTANPDLSTGAENRDQMPALYGPADSQPFPMVAPINIADARANIDSLMMELERDLPELALHRVRESSSGSGVAIRNAYSDASGRILEGQGNFDEPLVRAQMMGVSIGGLRRYDGFEGFNLESYERGNLMHFIKERPIFEDSLSIQDRIDKLIQSGAPPEAVWAEMNIPEDTIKQWSMSLMKKQQQQAMLQAMNQQPNQPPALPPGETMPQLPSGIQGDPLPDDEATADVPLTDEDAARINAMFAALKGAKPNG